MDKNLTANPFGTTNTANAPAPVDPMRALLAARSARLTSNPTSNTNKPNTTTNSSLLHTNSSSNVLQQNTTTTVVNPSNPFGTSNAEGQK